ncbi:MAG: enoyl-CoA hydratase-related protein [Parvibaculaceae bacterium]
MTTRTATTYEVKDRVGILTLNRPEVLNSINKALTAEVRATVKEVAGDENVGVLLITGAGRGFCAGADLAEQSARPEGMSVGQGVAHGMRATLNPMMTELYELKKPIISAVNGTVAGGGVGIALIADIVIAAKSASFISVFAPKLGLIPDLGVTWHLPRLVGRARAMGMALTGDKISAETAAEWGLIWKCVEDAALMEEAMTIAKKLAAGPSNAFSEVRKALDAAPHNSYADQLEYEAATQGVLGDHGNFVEGVKAFLTKTVAKFK